MKNFRYHLVDTVALGLWAAVWLGGWKIAKTLFPGSDTVVTVATFVSFCAGFAVFLLIWQIGSSSE